MNRQDLNKKLNELEPVAKMARELAMQQHPKFMAKDICCPSATYDNEVSFRPTLEEAKEFMVYKLSYALLKTQILKELYTYRSGRWMMRLKTPDSQYAPNCIVIAVDLLNGCEKAEAIFFADSDEDKKVVERELVGVLGGKSLQELLYEYIDNHAESLSECLDEDGFVKSLKEEQSK